MKRLIKAALVCSLCFIPGHLANIFHTIWDDSLIYFWGDIIYNVEVQREPGFIGFRCNGWLATFNRWRLI